MRYTGFIVVILFFLSLYGLLWSVEYINYNNPLIVINYNNPPFCINSFNRNCYINSFHSIGIINYVKESNIKINERYMSLEYNVSNLNSKLEYKIDFKGLDFTFFDGVSLKIKGDREKDFSKNIKIEIGTWNDSVVYIIDNISDKWKTYNIHKDDFLGDSEYFNWEAIEYITLVCENVLFNQKKGKYYIDDIILIPGKDTNLTLKNLKLQKYLKPRERLIGFPKEQNKSINIKVSNLTLLSNIAKDTWKYFQNIVDKNTLLVMDNITVDKNIEKTVIADYTNITNIGLQILCIISAYDMKYISDSKAFILIEKLLYTIKKLKTWNGLFYNYYLTKNNQIANKYISSVDNGWLAAGLICLRNSFDRSFYSKAAEILAEMNFNKLYNNSLGQLTLGYYTDKGQHSNYHYGLLNTESRIASLIGIGKGDIPKEHWFKMHRTFPPDWDWQKQVPKGKVKRLYGIDFFGGVYEYNNKRFVPSWGGSMFETLMPVIVLDEEKLAPNSLGNNDEIITRLHIKYCKDKGLKYWGFSPCSIPDSEGGYKEFGIPILGAKGYTPDNIVTPHAIILALLAIDERTVLENLKKIILDFPDVYGEYGLYDSINIETGNVTKKYLALDQGMILITLCNYLNKKSIQKRFEDDEIIQNIKELIAVENFYK